MKLFRKNNPPLTEKIPRSFIWRDIYENGGRLKLAPTIAEEVARLVTLEFSSRIYGSERAEVIDTAYRPIVKSIRDICESACAVGSVMLKPYFDGDKIVTSVVPADAYKIVAESPDGTVCDAVFFERITYDGKHYVKHEEHIIGKEVYIITNTAYEEKNGMRKKVSLSEVPQWRDLEERAEIKNLSVPIFACFSLPNAKPIFAKSVDLIEDAEKQYERILWEYESGERALYVDETAVYKNEHKGAELPSKRLYRMLNTGDDALFEDWTPELRYTALFYGLDRIFKRIEFNCGLAYGTISDQTSVEKTAEEIRSSKQRSYATVLEIQTALKRALLDWAAAADALCDLYGLVPEGSYVMDFDFDDSIVADRSTEFEERLSLLKNGVISSEEMRAWYLGEGENK